MQKKQANRISSQYHLLPSRPARITAPGDILSGMSSPVAPEGAYRFISREVTPRSTPAGGSQRRPLGLSICLKFIRLILLWFASPYKLCVVPFLRNRIINRAALFA